MSTEIESLVDVSELLPQMASQLQQRLPSSSAGACMIGIRSGGVWVARELSRLMGLQQAPGELNIAFYRDDFTRIGLHPQVTPSSLPFSVDDRLVILVDDVLMSGRTIRAAMNEIFDFGRPARVLLAVLADVGGRELPIQPDVCGCRLELAPGQRVKLLGPDPLRLIPRAAAGQQGDRPA